MSCIKILFFFKGRVVVGVAKSKFTFAGFTKHHLSTVLLIAKPLVCFRDLLDLPSKAEPILTHASRPEMALAVLLDAFFNLGRILDFC